MRFKTIPRYINASTQLRAAKLTYYRVAQKFGTLFVRLITSSNVDQFLKLFSLSE